MSIHNVLELHMKHIMTRILPSVSVDHNQFIFAIHIYTVYESLSMNLSTGL